MRYYWYILCINIMYIFPESVWAQGSSNSGGLENIFSSSHLLIFLHIFSSCPLAFSFFSISLLKAGAGKAFTDYQRQKLFQGFSQGGVGWSDVRTGHLAILRQIEWEDPWKMNMFGTKQLGVRMVGFYVQRNPHLTVGDPHWFCNGFRRKFEEH